MFVSKDGRGKIHIITCTSDGMPVYHYFQQDGYDVPWACKRLSGDEIEYFSRGDEDSENQETLAFLFAVSGAFDAL